MREKTNPENNDYSYPIRIDREGQWYHEGSRIARPAMVRLFASVLKRDKNGRYWLETPAEKGLIEVEDAPFVVRDMHVKNETQGQIITFTTNLDETIELGPSHALFFQEDIPYVYVRDEIPARIGRAVFFRLAEMAANADKQDGRHGLVSKGAFYPLEGE